MPKVIVIPNLNKILKVAGKRLLEDKGAEVLDKALGGQAGKILENLW